MKIWLLRGLARPLFQLVWTESQGLRLVRKAKLHSVLCLHLEQKHPGIEGGARVRFWAHREDGTLSCLLSWDRRGLQQEEQLGMGHEVAAEALGLVGKVSGRRSGSSTCARMTRRSHQAGGVGTQGFI